MIREKKKETKRRRDVILETNGDTLITHFHVEIALHLGATTEGTRRNRYIKNNRKEGRK